MVLSAEAGADINWWIDNAIQSERKITHGMHKVLLQTDASPHGWGPIRLLGYRKFKLMNGMKVQIAGGSSLSSWSTSAARTKGCTQWSAEFVCRRQQHAHTLRNGQYNSCGLSVRKRRHQVDARSKCIPGTLENFGTTRNGLICITFEGSVSTVCSMTS